MHKYSCQLPFDNINFSFQPVNHETWSCLNEGLLTKSIRWKPAEVSEALSVHTVSADSLSHSPAYYLTPVSTLQRTGFNSQDSRCTRLVDISVHSPSNSFFPLGNLSNIARCPFIPSPGKRKMAPSLTTHQQKHSFTPRQKKERLSCL